MKYTVIGTADGRRLEMPVEASSVVDAIHAGEEAGLVVTDVRGYFSYDDNGEKERTWADPSTRPVNELAPPPTRRVDPKPDSGWVGLAVLGFLVPLIGVLMGLVTLRKSTEHGLVILVASLVGFVLWGAMLSR